jgi:hypothetical protein
MMTFYHQNHLSVLVSLNYPEFAVVYLPIAVLIHCFNHLVNLFVGNLKITIVFKILYV